MRSAHRVFILLSAVFLCAIGAFGQDDAPSLGDVARQARLQKQKDAQPTPPAKNAQNQNKDGQSAVSPEPAAANTNPVAPAADAPGSAAGKDAAGAKPKRVITNDEIPEHVGPTSTHPQNSPTPGTNFPPVYPAQTASAEQWKAAIQQIKSGLASMQQQINNLTASIQYAGANCVANCVQWNERQKQKQDQVDQMKQQMEQMQKSLEDAQDAARKQGFGSSVYDP